jgi:hypothetical protein
VGSGQRGERGSGHDIGAEAPEGGGPRRDGSAATQLNFGEQSRTLKDREGEISGRGRLATSRENSGSLERR